MLKVLTAFHHRAARQITGTMAKLGAGGEWEYPEIEEAMESAGLHPFRVYINRLQTTIADRMVFRSVYALCTEVESMPGIIQMV